MKQIYNMKFSGSPITILLLLLLINSVYSYWNASIQAVKTDYFTLWAISQQLPAENIYSENWKKSTAQKTYKQALKPTASLEYKLAARNAYRLFKGKFEISATPFLHAVINILSTGNYKTDKTIFTIIACLSLIASLIILAKLLNFSLIHASLFFLLFSSFYPPLLTDISFGNLNQMQLLLLTLYLAFGQSRRARYILLSGFFLGLGIMLKPNTLFIAFVQALLLLLDKDIKNFCYFCLGNIISGIYAIVISVAFFGYMTVWLDFIVNLQNALTNRYHTSWGNLSFTNLIFDSFGINISVLNIIILISAIIILYFFAKKQSAKAPHILNVTTSQQQLDRLFLSVGLGSVIMFLSAGLIWIHYYVLVIPFLMFMLRDMNLSKNNIIKLLIPTIILLLFSSVVEIGISNGTNAKLSWCLIYNFSTFLLLIVIYVNLCQFFKMRNCTAPCRHNSDKTNS
ncbi:MAG: hypothetical protein L3J71_10055 [Victivallaceae bacterium]|nr:hypothetical protein [Victivallaceae bacterium]